MHSPLCNRICKQSAGCAAGRLCNSEWGIPKAGSNGVELTAEQISIRVIRGQKKDRPRITRIDTNDVNAVTIISLPRICWVLIFRLRLTALLSDS